MAREEDRLKERLADLEAERPALEAFYNALSPAQKMEMARGAMRDGMDRRMGERGRDGMMMRPHMFADAGRRGADGRPRWENARWARRRRMPRRRNAECHGIEKKAPPQGAFFVWSRELLTEKTVQATLFLADAPIFLALAAGLPQTIPP